MTQEEFLKLSSRGNLIPVYKQVPGDLETPVSAYYKLASGRAYSFLLESVEGQEKIARYSFIARDPELIFTAKGRQASILRLVGGDIHNVHLFLLFRHSADSFFLAMHGALRQCANSPSQSPCFLPLRHGPPAPLSISRPAMRITSRLPWRVR